MRDAVHDGARGQGQAPGLSRRLARAVLRIAFAVLMVSPSVGPSWAQSAGEAADPSIPSGPGVVQWHYRGQGLKLTLTQLRPDNVRAFLGGRGFTKADTEFVVQSVCIFGSSMGSAHERPGSPPVVILLKQWRAHWNGRSIAPRLREDWAKVWKARGADETAGVAFHWALFPTRQTYGPTDYNWGMITFPIPAGARIDLEVHWLNGDERHSARIRGLECGQ